jgi:hypothetical protein
VRRYYTAGNAFLQPQAGAGITGTFATKIK